LAEEGILDKDGVEEWVKEHRAWCAKNRPRK